MYLFGMCTIFVRRQKLRFSMDMQPYIIVKPGPGLGLGLASMSTAETVPGPGDGGGGGGGIDNFIVSLHYPFE